MARQRFIWPSLWTDATVGQLSPPARLLFIGCFSNADDDGRLEADPAYLKATIFPHDRFDAAAVQSFRDELVAKCRNIVLYEFDGRDYLAFMKWPDFQKPKYPRPSKLPAPPRKQRKHAQLTQKPSGNSPGSLPEDSSRLPPWDGLGREELGTNPSYPYTSPSVQPEPHKETSLNSEEVGRTETDDIDFKPTPPRPSTRSRFAEEVAARQAP